MRGGKLLGGGGGHTESEKTRIVMSVLPVRTTSFDGNYVIHANKSASER